jgi:hypothetical protein
LSAVIAAECLAHDYTDPGRPAIAWDGLALGDALVGALVTDAGRLLTRLEVGADEAKAAEALAWLALVAGEARTRSGPPVEEAPTWWVVFRFSSVRSPVRRLRR